MVGLAVHLLGFPAIWNPELPVIFFKITQYNSDTHNVRILNYL